MAKASAQAVVASTSVLTALQFRLAENFKPDIIIGTVPALPTLFVTRLLSVLLRRPYIIDLRDAWPELLDQAQKWNEATGQRSLRESILLSRPALQMRGLGKTSISRVLKHASGLTVTSQAHKEQLQCKFPKQEVAVVRNVFPAKAMPERKASSEEHQALRVLYAGTIGRAQKLDNVLDAIQLLPNDCPIELRFVGGGAGLDSLKAQAADIDASIEFYPRVAANEMTSHYSWADTALVHLTGWESLSLAIPSKTYELMEMGVHITACVSGEAAQLVSRLEAGVVASPDSPSELAAVFEDLHRNPSKLLVGTKARDWVRKERSIHSPRALLRLVSLLA